MGHRGLGQPHLGFRQRELPAALAAACSRGLEPGQGAFSDHRLWETAVLFHLRDALDEGLHRVATCRPTFNVKTLTVGFRPLPQTTR